MSAEGKKSQFSVVECIREGEDEYSVTVRCILTAKSKDAVLAYLIKNWEIYLGESDYRDFLSYEEDQDSLPKYEHFGDVANLSFDEFKRKYPRFITYLEHYYTITDQNSTNSIVIENID